MLDMLSDTAVIFIDDTLSWTGLHRAAWRGDAGQVELQAVADLARVNQKSSIMGVTPLHVAVMRRHVAAARTLLLFGADVNAKDVAGVKPLAYAAGAANVPMVRLLEENGA